MTRHTEPVFAHIGEGVAVMVEHRLADVLVMESPATPATFARLFARLPGLAMVVAVSPTGEIVVGIRDGTMLTLRPVHGVGNGSVPGLVVAVPLYLQWARCRWTLGIVDGRLEWDPQPGSKYVVTIGTWSGGVVSQAGERAEFQHPFSQPGGMR